MAAPLATTKKNKITVELYAEENVGEKLSSLSKPQQSQIASNAFEGKNGQTAIIFDENGLPKTIISVCNFPATIFDGAKIADFLGTNLSADILQKNVFAIKAAKDIDENDAFTLNLGWCLHDYLYADFKEQKKKTANLVISEKSLKNKVEAHLSAITNLRNLINRPANLLGPEQLENAAKDLGKTFKAKISVIKDKALLEKNFPLIYTVGQAAAPDRRPRLIDLRWGKKGDPKITLVGKGVCFDTGGLDIKSSPYMRYMKKDMGGAAHALAVAEMVMTLNLPVQLRVLIPAVENAISAEAFRAGDIIKSRKGIAVENTNTDAEGRLILADALAYACEDAPELIIDFATLTGSARAALGPDIPAMFSNDKELAAHLETLSHDIHDPLWNMPLYSHYRRFIESPNADIVNSAGLPGDLIYSALFLNEFVDSEKSKWVHIDCYAWEETGRPGRPKGGSDTGARAVFALLQQHYGVNTK